MNRPPWDRRPRRLPRLPRRAIRVQVKVIEVGGSAQQYRRSRSFTIKSRSFSALCELLEAWIKIVDSPPGENPTSGGLTASPPGA